MAPAANTVSPIANAQVPPRERILAAASDLFYRQGIRAVGVEAIAEAAGTNKMTLYRHFASKDELVAEYLRCLARDAGRFWDELAAAHPGDPRAQLRGWLAAMQAHVRRRRPARLRARQCGDRTAREGPSGAPRDRAIQERAARPPGRAVRRDRHRRAGAARRRVVPAARRRARQRAELRAERPRLAPRAHGRSADRVASRLERRPFRLLPLPAKSGPDEAPGPHDDRFRRKTRPASSPKRCRTCSSTTRRSSW